MRRILVVVAVPPEAAAILSPANLPPTGPPAGPPAGGAAAGGGGRLGPYEVGVVGGVTVLAGGVGPARAGAAAGTALGLGRFDLVVSAGVGGGFGLGDLVVADRIVHADLGADSPDGFLPVDRLGFGTATTVLDAELVARAATATGAVIGPVLTVSTVTGTAERAAELVAAHAPAAEAMEGAGVLAAAEAHGVPFLELRAVSNPVGPRNRAAWDLPGALARLGPAVRALATLPAADAGPARDARPVTTLPAAGSALSTEEAGRR